MTDDHSSEQHPPDPARTGASDGFCAGDLDAALDEVCALAEDLNADLGGGESADHPLHKASEMESSSSIHSESALEPSATDNGERDIEADLTEIDRLLDETEGELGADAGSFAGSSGHALGDTREVASVETDTPVVAPASESVNKLDSVFGRLEPAAPDELAVPSFMSEFTNKAEPTCKQQNEETVEPAEPLQTPTVGIVGTGIVNPRAARSPLNDADDADDADDAAGAEDDADSGESRLSNLASRLEGPAYALAKRGASTLERMNEPVANVGPALRNLAGLIALATLGIALIVYLISLI